MILRSYRSDWAGRLEGRRALAANRHRRHYGGGFDVDEGRRAP